MAKNFKEILENIDSEKKVLTESVQAELVTMMEAKEKEIKEQAYEKALTIMNDKMKQVDEEHATKMQALVEKVKEKYEKQLEAMDEDHSKKLQHVVETIDKSHTAKVKQLMEAVDTDHSSKVEKLMEAIDEDHAKKLTKVVETIKESVVDGKLVDQISDYLDLYLEKVMPKKALINEARLGRLEKFYKNIKELSMVNDEYVQTEIKEAVEDASQQLSKKDEEIDHLMMEKVELTSKIKKIEAAQLLSEKCKDLAPSLTSYAQTRFEKSTKEEIEEQFNEAIEAFKKEEKSKRAKLTETSQTKAKVKNPDIITEDQSLSLEKKDADSPDASSVNTENMNEYVHILSKSLKR